MKFYNEETIETAIIKAERDGNPIAFFITSYSEGAEPAYRIVRDTKDGMFSLVSLDERQEPFQSDIQRTNLSIRQAIENYVVIANVSNDNIQIYHTLGNRGLVQVMASRETLETVLQDRYIGGSEAVALVAIAQESLELPITINGSSIKKSPNHSPFYKVAFEAKGEEGFRTTYTMDVSNILKR